MNDNRCEGWEYNQELCRQLAELQKAGEILKRSVFATRALAKAIEIIREWTRKNKREIRIEDFYENNPKTGPVTIEKVASGKASNGKYKIKGIGKGISKKLYQYCTTGMIEDVQRARDKVLEAKLLKQGKIKNLSSRDKAILALTKVAHIGPKKAEELYNDYHKRTGKDLTRQILMRDKKMYKKLTKNQQLMLKYHDQIEGRVPREFISMLELTLGYLTKKIFGSPKKAGYKIVFGGSYRRGHKDSGDIDILVKKDKKVPTPKGKKKFTFAALISLLKQWGIIFEKLTGGNKTFQGLGRCPGMPDFVFRIDLFYTENPKEWIPFLIGKTGNKDNNTRLRFKANQMGLSKDKKQSWTLNDYGLFIATKGKKGWKSTGKRVKPEGFTTEEELFEFLEVPYLTPEQRG